ncbi:MAG: acyl carrier protein [Steroidobacteraceae bacterium]
MTKDEIFARLSAILQENFGTEPEKITLAARLYEDLDIDSIDAVDMMVKLRSLTQQRLQPEAFRSVRTIGDVVDVVHLHFTEKV